MTEEINKRVSVAVRIRPKIASAVNATQVAERYHTDAALKVSDTIVRLTDTSAINEGGGNTPSTTALSPNAAAPSSSGTGGASGKDARSNVFSFDYVFDKDSTQAEVYEETTLDAVDEALASGTNGTIMTYGQTGSGKTFTVLGAIGNNPLSDDVVTSETGLFLRVLKDLLAFAEERRQDRHVVIGLSVTEVYLDTVRDLLGAPAARGQEPAALKVIIDNDNVRLPDVTYRPINAIRDAVAAYKTATERRVSRATGANDTSSRSHAIFFIDIFQQRRYEDVNPEPMSIEELVALRERSISGTTSATGPTGIPNGRRVSLANSGIGASPKMGKSTGNTPPGTPGESGMAPPAFGKEINRSPPIDTTRASNPVIRGPPGMPAIVYSRLALTDLAGSEKMKHSNMRGEGFEEMKKINASLTALGNVVHSLFTEAKHIPYRDTKLTVLLRSSFATPFSRIVLITNVAPTSLTYEETLSSLFFADKVKAMKVDPAQTAGLGSASEQARLEAEMLRSAKVVEELTADFRILRETYGNYKPCIALAGARQLGSNSKDTCMGPLDIHYHTRKGGARPSATDKDYKAVMQAATQLSVKEVEDYKKEDAAALAAAMEQERHAQCDAQVAGYHERRAKAQGYYESNETLHKERIQELDDRAKELEKEVAQETSTGTENEKQIKKEESALADLRKQMESLVAEDTKISAGLAKIEQEYRERYKGEQVAWDTSCEKFEQASHRQDTYEGFFINREQLYGAVRLEYISGLVATEKVYRDLAVAAKELETFEITHWIRTAVKVMANNAVVRSHKAALRARVPLLKAQVTGTPAKPAQDDQQQQQDMIATEENNNNNNNNSASPGVNANNVSSNNIAAGGASPSTSPSTTHIDPNSSVSGAPPKTRPPGKQPPAPRKALTAFDQPTLLQQVTTYMVNGCALLKHGRKGSPHYRMFNLVINEEKGTVRLYWDEEGTTRKPGESSSFVNLFQLDRIVLGKFSKVFKKNYPHALDNISPSKAPRNAASPEVKESKTMNLTTSSTDEDFYTSFSLHYQQKGEARTLDLTCETIAEMEAWVIGICNAARMNPCFGVKWELANLDASPLSGEAGAPPETPSNGRKELNEENKSNSLASKSLLSMPAYQHLQPFCSNDAEVHMCEQWHIPPPLWLQIKTKVQMIVQRHHATAAAAAAAAAAASRRGSSSFRSGEILPPPPPPPVPHAPSSTTPSATHTALPPVSITPGELRQMCQGGAANHNKVAIDIFRANAMWNQLVRLGLIEKGRCLTYLDFDKE